MRTQQPSRRILHFCRIVWIFRKVSCSYSTEQNSVVHCLLLRFATFNVIALVLLCCMSCIAVSISPHWCARYNQTTGTSTIGTSYRSKHRVYAFSAYNPQVSSCRARCRLLMICSKLSFMLVHMFLLDSFE